MNIMDNIELAAAITAAYERCSSDNYTGYNVYSKNEKSVRESLMEEHLKALLEAQAKRAQLCRHEPILAEIN